MHRYRNDSIRLINMALFYAIHYFAVLLYVYSLLYCIHTKGLSRLKSGVEFDMNDIFYEFKYLHHI